MANNHQTFIASMVRLLDCSQGCRMNKMSDPGTGESCIDPTTADGRRYLTNKMHPSLAYLRYGIRGSADRRQESLTSSLL